MFVVSEEEFEQIVSDGIASIPQNFRDDFENLAFVIDYEPTAEVIASALGGKTKEGYEILGLYSGVPLTKRVFKQCSGPQKPDLIYIFSGSHFRVTHSLEELTERVRQTIVHEVGHYFGMDEQQLKEMGYGSALA